MSHLLLEFPLTFSRYFLPRDVYTSKQDSKFIVLLNFNEIPRKKGIIFPLLFSCTSITIRALTPRQTFFVVARVYQLAFVLLASDYVMHLVLMCH